MLFDPLSPQARAEEPPLAPAPTGSQPPTAAASWMARMLDEIDYGMLLLAEGSAVVYANHVARHELDSLHPLQLLGRQLRVRWHADIAPLHGALADASKRGLRRLVTLGQGQQRISVAVVPMGGDADGGNLTLMVFGKRRLCPALSAHWFARDHGLTPAEARVLTALCEGRSPGTIASEHDVALSTVRSQIGAIRTKTGAPSIRALVGQVSVLPPLVNALRLDSFH